MRYVLIALALLTLSVYAVRPARAEAMDGCSMGGMTCHSTDMTTIQSLRDCVEHAVQEGHITNRGVATALLKLVDTAQAAQDGGRTAAAVRSLGAFILLVESQAGASIDPGHADCLIMHAEMVVEALGG